MPRITRGQFSAVNLETGASMRPWRFATDNEAFFAIGYILSLASMRPWRFATDNDADDWGEDPDEGASMRPWRFATDNTWKRREVCPPRSVLQ